MNIKYKLLVFGVFEIFSSKVDADSGRGTLQLEPIRIGIQGRSQFLKNIKCWRQNPFHDTIRENQSTFDFPFFYHVIELILE